MRRAASRAQQKPDMLTAIQAINAALREIENNLSKAIDDIDLVFAFWGWAAGPGPE